MSLSLTDLPNDVLERVFVTATALLNERACGGYPQQRNKDTQNEADILKATRLNLRASCSAFRRIHDEKWKSRITGVKVKKVRRHGSDFEGFELTTDFPEHSVYTLIEDGQFCCEEYGFDITVCDAANNLLLAVHSEQDYDTESFFIPESGMKKDKMCALSSVLVGQSIVNVKYEGDAAEEDEDDVHQLIVRVRTANGLLVRLRLYNEHNGYYPHETMVKWYAYVDNTNSL